MELRITHETRYDYTPAVETAQHMVHLQPMDTPYQQLLGHQLNIFPAAGATQPDARWYGNQRTFFSLEAPHTTLRVVAVSEVRTRRPGCRRQPAELGGRARALPLARRRGLGRGGGIHVCLVPCAPGRGIRGLCAGEFPAGRRLIDAARDLMTRIHTDFSYDRRAPRSTPRPSRRWPSAGACARTSLTS